jgi:putative FmdB family regulatory protein
MPTYEYSCQKCGQNFDAFQSMRDEAFRECPKELCRLPKWGHGKVKRLLGTGAGLIFKGSGFYHHRLPKRFLQGGSQKGGPCYLVWWREIRHAKGTRERFVACSG